MTPSLNLWSSPPEKLELASAQIHLWRFRLDLPVDQIIALQQLLSADELARSERLLDRNKANQFVVARARLRQILSRYLGLNPAELEFYYAEQGKPSLSKASGRKLKFNLSHAGHWGLLAITAETEVGVDIEQIDPQLNFKQVAFNYFSPAEITRLEHYQPARRRRGFYRIWTRKEASLKMTGSGFSLPQVSQMNMERQIKSFVVDKGCLGAVSVVGVVTLLQRWDFS